MLAYLDTKQNNKEKKIYTCEKKFESILVKTQKHVWKYFSVLTMIPNWRNKQQIDVFSKENAEEFEESTNTRA